MTSATMVAAGCPRLAASAEDLSEYSATFPLRIRVKGFLRHPKKAEMGTGYEHQTDQQFWTEVAGLLQLIIRHHGGTPATQVTGLADYVHAEAERRDPALAASRRRRNELARTAAAREPVRFEAPLTPLPFTDTEKAAWQQAITAYNERFASLAARYSQ